MAVKPCVRRDASARRAPRVAAGDGVGTVGVGADWTVWVLIPVGAAPHPQIMGELFVRVGGTDRLRESVVAPQSLE